MTTAADLVQEVIDAHRFDKDGESLVEDIVRLHLAQSQKSREDLVEVYRNWIKSSDSIKADWAIALIRRLGLVGELPLLEGTMREIRQGKSKLPKYFEQFLAPAIEELKHGERS